MRKLTIGYRHPDKETLEQKSLKKRLIKVFFAARPGFEMGNARLANALASKLKMFAFLVFF
jgi:hypothetical protein